MILATRLNDVKITVTDIRPPAMSGWDVDKYLYRFCAQFSGTPTQGMPTTMMCDEEAIGRYVYLMVPSTQYMTGMCTSCFPPPFT